ncbi:hypothetical protein BKH33_13295 [Actinomyces naeslundii]|uniref:Uncharacterized protein n=1 Tax=Actinomyces naeslundii TaxID=1655 RepID=A0A854D2A0_ACTNA|nr:hypothetical protein BKH33_13295 [Actinomyces naeslundii]
MIREPHRLQDCGLVLAEIPKRHLYLGDGSSQGGLSDAGPLVPFMGGIHLLLKSRLDGRLQWILLAASPLLQTS